MSLGPSICYTDTGGTFTDTFIVDEQGDFVVAKAPTIPQDIAAGYFESVRLAAAQLGLDLPQLLSQLNVVGYGATTVINRLVTQGARVGVVLNEGQEGLAAA